MSPPIFPKHMSWRLLISKDTSGFSGGKVLSLRFARGRALRFALGQALRQPQDRPSSPELTR